MKIIIINPGGVSNLGERAIMQGTMYYIKQTYPDAEVVIYGYKNIDDVDPRLYRELKKSVKKLTFRDELIKGSGKVNRAIYAIRLLLSPRSVLGDRGYEEIKGSDLVISKGQETLTENYGFVHYVDSILEQYIVSRMNRSIQLLGHSIGPVRKHKIIAKFVLRNFSRIEVRDNKSLNALLELGFPNTKTSQIKDMAYMGIDKYDDLTKIDIRQNHCLIIPNAAILHGNESSKLAYLDVLSSLIERCIALNKPVIIGSSVATNDWNDDYSICHELKKRYPIMSLREYGTLYDFLVDIRGSHLVISSRLHPLIMSNAQAKRLIAVSDSHKVHGLLGDVGLAESILSPFNRPDTSQIEMLIN